jgi:hypothetical protein
MKPSLLLAALAVVSLASWAGAYLDHAGSQMGSAARRQPHHSLWRNISGDLGIPVKKSAS